MRRDVDAEVLALALPRGGPFLRTEVRAAGGDRRLEGRRRAAGVWRSITGEVLVITSFPDTLHQRRWVALLAGGGGTHLSFETAAEVHRLEGVRRGLTVATTAHPNHLEVPGVTFHRLDDVAPHHLTTIDGYPITTATRTIIDLAAVISWMRLRRVIEDAITRRLTTFTAIARMLQEVRRRGKPGVRKLVATLDSLGGEAPPASEGERLLHDAARLARVRIVRQHPLPGRAHVAGVVDAIVPASKLILEADSRTWHARLDAMASDRARDREAARVGWLTLRFVYADLAGDLRSCADDIRVTHLDRIASGISGASVPELSAAIRTRV